MESGMDAIIMLNNGKIIFGDPEKNIENSLAKIKESTDYLIKRNQKLSDQLNHYNKISGIDAKNDEIRSIQQRSITIFSHIEYERDKAFKEKHYKQCKNGNHFIYDLQGTGIGTIIKIKCPICGAEEDITDTDSW